MLYCNPKSIGEALELLKSYKGKDVVVLAGGTDVVPKLNARPEMSGYFDGELTNLDEKVIVYLGDLDLKYIKDEGDNIVIGAMTTMTEILESEVIDKVAVMKEAISQMAGITIRNVATIGGNIMNASPAADSVPALIASGAKAVFIGPDGEREEELYKIFTGPGKTNKHDEEILKEIIVPVNPGKAKFIKFGRRKAESLSIVNGAVYAEMDGNAVKDIRIAIGSVAPTPLRLTEVEDIIIGKEVTDDVLNEAVEKAASIVKPITDKRGSGEYRTKLVKVLIKRAVGDVVNQ